MPIDRAELNALFTGYTMDGGYAEYAVAYPDYCFPLAAQIPVKTDTRLFPLNEANEALTALRKGEIHGAAVLVM